MRDAAAVDTALATFPPNEYEAFAPAEFEGRVEAARRVMRAVEIEALLVTSEANLPLEGTLCAIVPRTNVDGMRQTSWVRHIRSWIAPCPEDDGVRLVAAALRGVGR